MNLLDLLDSNMTDQKQNVPKVQSFSRDTSNEPIDLFDFESKNKNGDLVEDDQSKNCQIVLNQRGIEMQLFVDSVGFDSNGLAQLRFLTVNNTPGGIEDFNLAVAVTKAYQIELLPANSTTLQAHALSTITQKANLRRLTASKAPRLRLKVSYRLAGAMNTIDAEVTSIACLAS